MSRVTLAIDLCFLIGTATFAAAEEPARPSSEARPRPSIEEPVAPEYSPANAAAYLDRVGRQWTQQRNCGSCHTNYPYLMARPSLAEFRSPDEAGIRAFFEDRVAHWDDARPEAKPRWDAEVLATAEALAMHDAATTGKLHPLTRAALDRMWTLQKPEGGWDWLKCGWPPFEHDDYYGSLVAALAAGYAPEGYAREDLPGRGIERIRAYFRKTPAPDLHHRTILLWASARVDGLMDQDEREKTIAELRALQRPDGSWSLPSLGRWNRRDGRPNDRNAPGDGYATGLVVFVLREAGVSGSDPAIERGLAWLRANQRASGRWFTRSLNNDKAHYITDAGTCFAVLALQRGRPPAPPRTPPAPAAERPSHPSR
ncbi:MAG: prenyltransferase/squalene oxidase repeat-containing protein [Isosphaeraceae bacterium]